MYLPEANLKPGEPFNPWRGACGFYPPDVLGRRLDFTDGEKRLYDRAVRWAGRKGTFWHSFETMAAELGKSVRQIKRDMAALERGGLISHIRRSGTCESNLYSFTWHSMFDSEVPSTSLRDEPTEVTPTALRAKPTEVTYLPTEVTSVVKTEVTPTAHELSKAELRKPQPSARGLAELSSYPLSRTALSEVFTFTPASMANFLFQCQTAKPGLEDRELEEKIRFKRGQKKPRTFKYLCTVVLEQILDEVSHQNQEELERRELDARIRSTWDAIEQSRAEVAEVA